MKALELALEVAAFGYGVWLMFLAVMSLKAARDAGRLPRETLPFAWLAVAIGYVLDFAFNVLASVLFLELPRETTFTARASRHVHDPGWRGALSRWFCRVLLDPFQIGGHCK